MSATLFQHHLRRNVAGFFDAMADTKGGKEAVDEARISQTGHVISFHESNSPGCFSPRVNCCIAMPLNNLTGNGMAANTL
jgi:hypothetical protein